MKRLHGFQLSSQQKYLWLLSQQDRISSIQATFLSTRPLHMRMLFNAIHASVRRHSILRTSYQELPGMKFPLQVIDERDNFFWCYVDFSTIDTQNQERQLEILLYDEQSREIDPGRGPLLRVLLVALAPHTHLLICSLPSLSADAETLSLLIHDITLQYEGNRRAELPDDDLLQYIQYVEWQNEPGQNEEALVGQAYWRTHTITNAGVRLSFEHAVQKADAWLPGAFTKVLRTGIVSELHALVASYQVDIPAFMLTSWLILLWRLTGETPLSIGYRHTGRHYEELTSMLGPTAKWVPIPCQVERNMRFSSLLEQTYTTLIDIHSWIDYFEPDQFLRLSEEEHQMFSLFPLFQFEFKEEHTEGQEEKIIFSPYKQIIHKEPFKIKITCTLQQQQLHIAIYYNAEVFVTEDIHGIARQLLTLIECFVKNPEVSIDEAEILDDVERRRVLVEYNRTQAEYPHDQCFSQLFESQVACTPENIALVFGDSKISYRGLNARANQLARHLCSLGVGPEVTVGLCTERSPEMLIGLIGILKAGGVYVPLDLTLPDERFRFLIKNTEIKVILANQESRSVFLEQDIPVIYLGQLWDSLDHISDANIPPCVQPSNLAYILYTSGSTGRPKGVMVSHQGLINYLSWCVRAYSMMEGEGVPVHSPLSFDLTITSVLAPLLVGQKLLLAENEGIRSLESLLRKHHDLSLVKMTPSHLNLLCQTLSKDELNRRMRTLVLGGEALQGESFKTWRLYAPDTRIINEYGPTETVVGCCAYEVSAAAASLEKVPIGQPIANTQLYILDASMSPLPFGVAGELYIGGDGLARGYLTLPDVTAERFVPHPFSLQPGTRLYRTGDLVRYCADGNIEYLGRLDRQIKLRGFRIEPDEIEAALCMSSGVQNAVVVLREDTPDDKRLVAYIVPDQPFLKLPVKELRRIVQIQLPDYMLPSTFVQLEAFPLTPNGKIDYLALPNPDNLNILSTELSHMPRTPIEEIVANIWAEVLRLNQIGIHDNFFERGGHSLLAAQVIARIQEVLHVKMLITYLFEAPTVAELAAFIESAEQTDPALTLPSIEPVLRNGNLPLSFAQQRIWFLEQWETGRPLYNTFTLLRLSGKLEVAVLGQSLAWMLQRHEVLRACFPAPHGIPVQQITPMLTISLPVVDLSGLPADEQATQFHRLGLQAAEEPFDLAHGPLLRACLLRLQPQEHRLLWVVHHIIFDHWSLGIFLGELACCYDALRTGRVVPLPDLTVQYADYASWQQQHWHGSALEPQLHYWREQFHAAPAALNLPTDFARPAFQSFRGARFFFELDASLSLTLKAVSQREGVTLFMTLLAGWSLLLARLSGQSDLVIGTPIVDRGSKEAEKMIGLFVNTLALRIQLVGEPTVRTLLKQIREICLGAYSHRELPFERLIEELQPKRDLSRHALFQILFSLQTETPYKLDLSDLTIEQLHADSRTAQFDLVVEFQDMKKGLQGIVDYNTDLFKHETIEQLFGHLQILLASMVAQLDQPAATLALLSEKERQQILVDWNQTHTIYPTNAGLHQLIEAQVECTPEAIAVCFEEQCLTYQELHRRSTSTALFLQHIGVEPEAHIGIYMERSLELVIGLLGILKAGGAYVPLDPDYPSERLNFMIEDAQLVALLTHRNGDRRSEFSSVPTLDIKDIQALPETSIHLKKQSSSENIAYIIYTSGSTGVPKGVQVSHAAFTNVINAMHQQFNIAERDIFLAITTIAFDIAGLELFLPLVSGARLELVSRVVASDAQLLLEHIKQSGATMMQATPVTWRLLLEAGWERPSWQQLTAICGGEALSHNLAKAIRTRVKALWNMYGPTESTIWSTAEHIAQVGETISIGRPIANTQIYLLDTHLQPVPMGVIGEVYIGGKGIARSYFNRPDLTAEKMIPHPFGSQPGERIYRTGDLARYTKNGTLEFLGRIDTQIKLHGYRIELGEIEQILQQHPNIRQAAVLLREDQPDQPRLVAYAIPTQDTLSTADLRSFLARRLPDFMIPVVFVLKEDFLLTPNGKIDRNKLLSPKEEDILRESVEPRTPLEREVAHIWGNVLGLEKVGVYDNFFAIGGHSLLAMQVIVQIRNLFSSDLTLRELFEAPTISELVPLIEIRQGTLHHGDTIVPLSREQFRKTISNPSFLQGHS